MTQKPDWTPPPRQSCYNCKHGHVAASALPCDACYDFKKWEAKR